MKSRIPIQMHTYALHFKSILYTKISRAEFLFKCIPLNHMLKNQYNLYRKLTRISGSEACYNTGGIALDRSKDQFLMVNNKNNSLYTILSGQ